MSSDPHIHVPTYIPPDIQQAYLDDARQQVRQRGTTRVMTVTAAPVVPAPTPMEPAGDRTLLLTGLVAAAVGLLGLVGWWGYLAWTTSETVWFVLALFGAIAVLHMPAAIVTTMRVRTACPSPWR
jgi:hypothetical protein